MNGFRRVLLWDKTTLITRPLCDGTSITPPTFPFHDSTRGCDAYPPPLTLPEEPHALVYADNLWSRVVLPNDPAFFFACHTELRYRMARRTDFNRREKLKSCGLLVHLTNAAKHMKQSYQSIVSHTVMSTKQETTACGLLVHLTNARQL